MSDRKRKWAKIGAMVVMLLAVGAAGYIFGETSSDTAAPTTTVAPTTTTTTTTTIVVPTTTLITGWGVGPTGSDRPTVSEAVVVFAYLNGSDPADALWRVAVRQRLCGHLAGSEYPPASHFCGVALSDPALMGIALNSLAAFYCDVAVHGLPADASSRDICTDYCEDVADILSLYRLSLSDTKLWHGICLGPVYRY